MLWCVAPGLDDHAEHLAVEFVHPASVGGRPIPAMAVPTTDPVRMAATLRRNVRTGDVVITLGDGDHPIVCEITLRAKAWGATVIHIGWIGDGNVLADHSVLLGCDHSAEPFLTRTYHLLWELTFLCLGGHGDLRSGVRTVSGSDAASCAVCADEAAVGELIGAPIDGLASVRTACGEQLVDVTLLDDARTFDVVLVHAGTAIERLYAEGP